MISQKAKYALRAIMALAGTKEPVLIGDIAEQENIPKRFLEQILLDLKHQGLVMSRRGRIGGYFLVRPPEDITIGEVLRTIDGPLAPLPCLSKMAYRACDDCDDEATCRVKALFADVAEATRRALDQTTFADAIAKKHPLVRARR
ncbi:MAG: Rrf2 family transcriptional regulator [Alphaproteobacteria bacterium]|nr:Rrf2 family transcriptional regulator [Alphaproteobacteria bacterium]